MVDTALIKVDNLENSIRIYPNPVNDYLYIESTEVIGFCIYDLYGNQILSGHNKVVDVRSLQSGMFLLKISTTNNKDLIIRFVRYK
ncbi:MAG: T9SS type A sorting domain-containing protein [Bacteroidales bacterium]|nr:T9SS type A sorting domain-containing protein [Bacteroidales bacterium]